jgi:hypothetical protein
MRISSMELMSNGKKVWALIPKQNSVYVMTNGEGKT